MNDHQQRPSLPRQHTPQEEGEEWYDEQDGGVPIEEEAWPPRTRTSAVRCQATAHSAPPENSPGAHDRDGTAHARRASASHRHPATKYCYPPAPLASRALRARTTPAIQARRIPPRPLAGVCGTRHAHHAGGVDGFEDT